jgi:hypothetical protein
VVYYKKNDSVVGRKIADELILVPVNQNIAEINSIYSLNELGARIWELIDSETTLESIASAIIKEYKVDIKQAKIDIQEFLDHLVEIGAVKSTANKAHEEK